MSDAVRRDEVVLSDEDEHRLNAALDDLRTAVAAYQGASDGDDVGTLQEAVHAAEDELWRLRERLLGWARPAWVPGATLTADWFSDEDSVYDDLTEPTTP